MGNYIEAISRLHSLHAYHGLNRERALQYAEQHDLVIGIPYEITKFIGKQAVDVQDLVTRTAIHEASFMPNHGRLVPQLFGVVLAYDQNKISHISSEALAAPGQIFFSSDLPNDEYLKASRSYLQHLDSNYYDLAEELSHTYLASEHHPLIGVQGLVDAYFMVNRQIIIDTAPSN